VVVAGRCGEDLEQRLPCRFVSVSTRQIWLLLAAFSRPVNVGGVVKFRVLGLLEVSEGDRPISLPRGKERALLGLLLAHANEPLPSERLIEELWPRRRPSNATKTVQIYVSRLRGHLGRERIRTTPAGYLLLAAPDELDAASFARLAADGRGRLEAGDAAAAEALLSQALQLWRGEALADFRFDSFAQTEVRRLEELRRSAVVDRVEARLALGRPDEVVAELETLVSEQPLWERPRRQLMLALYQTGRQADALALYRSTRTLLADELGLDPSSELQELERAILNQAPELNKSQRAPPVEADSAAEAARGAFVGRETELAALVAGLEDILAGRGRVFLIVGEPGIGKSRLAEELTRRARVRGAQVLVGRCWEAGGAPAYWPWVQSLRGCIRDTDSELLRAQLGPGAPDLAQILPELRRLFPDLPAPLAPESPAARFRFFDATAGFLRNASERRPLLLILDDLHAADAPSLLLLQFLARELASSRILLLAAYRDVDPTPGEVLTSVLAELAREPVTRRLSLTGLAEQDVAKYVEQTASEIASPQLVAALHAETEGNPLFVTETVRLLKLDQGTAMSPEVQLVIPQSVRDVISRRLAHLSPECNRVLTLGSVLGREFAPTALASLAGLSEDALLETLDDAVVARVVSDVPGSLSRLRFAHVLIRDTLYEGLTMTHRVRLHRRALEVLEALYGEEPGPQLAELAHHAIAGSDVVRGVLYAQRAGDHALASLAYEEAARLYELGLGVLESDDRPHRAEKCELLLALGHAQVRAGDADAAKETFLQAAEVARRLALPEALARAALGYGGRFVWARAGSDERLVPLLREALAGADEGDATLRARLLGRLAAALGDAPEGEERMSLSHEAVQIARSAGDGSTLAYTLVARLAVIWSPALVEERLALATELVELAERIGDKERAVEGHGLRFNALFELGDVDAADADLAARGKLTSEMRQPAQLWVQLILEAARCLFRGEFAAAERAMSEAFELRGARGSKAADAAFELQHFVLRREQGRLAELTSRLERCATAHPTRPVLRCALTNLFARLDRSDEARLGLAALAADGFRALSSNGDWLISASFLAEACRLVDDGAAAVSLYRHLRPYAERNVNGEGEVSTGAVSRYLGLLAATVADLDDAADHFEHALDLNARMGARPWLAHTQNDYAEVLLLRGRSADRARAQELRNAAHATFHELGMKPRGAQVATAGAISETRSRRD
jgi:DNA-binding SARP family transcriptional activator